MPIDKSQYTKGMDLIGEYFPGEFVAKPAVWSSPPPAADSRLVFIEARTAVNERDGLGDDLVPDYITSVREDAFYGWPFSYFGKNEDPRLKGKRPELVARAVVPDYAVGSHTASLGLVFYSGRTFPERYRGGAFVGQRGSWNRSRFAISSPCPNPSPDWRRSPPRHIRGRCSRCSKLRRPRRDRLAG